MLHKAKGLLASHRLIIKDNVKSRLYKVIYLKKFQRKRYLEWKGNGVVGRSCTCDIYLTILNGWNYDRGIAKVCLISI